MRVVFMGTPAFAVPSLTRLAQEHDVALVLTRPDAVRSRGKKLEPSPVKVAALELGLPVLEANRIDADVLNALRDAHMAASFPTRCSRSRLLAASTSMHRYCRVGAVQHPFNAAS